MTRVCTSRSRSINILVGYPRSVMKPRPPIAGMESVAHWLDRIVRDGKRLDRDIADREFGTGPKDSPVFCARTQSSEATNGLGRLRVAINRKGKFPAKHLQPANVIAMLMGKKQSIELLGGDAALLKPDHDLARAQSAIDQEFGSDRWKRERYSRRCRCRAWSS